MRFIKYLLNGIINCIDAFAGKSNNGVSIQQALFGLLFLAMSIAIFFVFLIFFDKTFGIKIYMLCSNKKLVIKNKFHNDTLHRPHINQ